MNGPWFGDATLARRCAGVGAGAWLTIATAVAPHPWDESFGRLLLLLAPLVLLPLCAGGGGGPSPRRGKTKHVVLWSVCVAGVAISQALSRGAIAAIASVPWALFLAAWGASTIRGVVRARAAFRSPRALCTFAAPLLGVVGGAWTVLERLGFRPLDLPEEIVLLTAIHFHFAGILLPLVAGALLADRRGAAAWSTALLVVGGVPLVAAGITASELGAPPLLESLAAWALACGGAWIAVRLVRAAAVERGVARVAAAVAAPSLLAGMVLAALYAARHWIDMPWLSVPWMRGVHGGLNALGFGVAGAGFVDAVERASASRPGPPDPLG